MGLGCEWVDLPGDRVSFRLGVRGFVEACGFVSAYYLVRTRRGRDPE